MNDPRNSIIPPEAQALIENLQARLLLKSDQVGRLVAVCMQAYQAQLSPKSEVSVALLEEIHRVWPGWSPAEAPAERKAWPSNAEAGTTRLRRVGKR